MKKICENCSCEYEAHNTVSKFCSRSCAATFNNKKYPKRYSNKKYYCCVCGEETGNRRKYCDKCAKTESNPNYVDWDDVTLGEIIEKRGYQKHSRIRTLARSKYLKSGGEKCCAICGYDKYFEIHHIKPINEFDDDSKIGVDINNVKNLIALCPNHHWEFDNGLLTMGDL